MASDRLKYKTFLLLFCGLLGFLFLKAEFKPPQEVSYLEVPRYSLPNDSQTIILPVNYARAVLLQPERYQGIEARQVYQIDLVFTRYPRDFQDWRTNYDSLLQQRLRALYALDSGLFSQPCQWRYILQTDPQDEPSAKTFFHGFVLHWEPLPLPSGPSPSLKKLIAEEPDGKAFSHIVYGDLPRLSDSSVYKVWERNPGWDSLLVVMDWTISMYQNGASVLRWHREHLRQHRLHHLVIFNDGDGRPHGAKQIGRTGGVHYGKPDSIDQVIELMVKVKKAGLGGDAPENDLEALLKASKNLESYDELVLIPDRNSSIRDLGLVRYLDHPVRIVLFNNPKIRSSGLGGPDRWVENPWIHPHYLTLASLSGGSIHTERQDILGLAELKAGETFTYRGLKYLKKENGAFVYER